MAARLRPLWTCPRCGERFAQANPREHSCGRFSADALFSRSEPHVRRIFDRLAAVAREFGLVRVYAQKTRIVIQARIRFASGQPRKSVLVANLLLPPGVASPRISKRSNYGSRHYIGAEVRLSSEAEVDDEMRRLMKLAYRVGCQDHLRS
jgi:Domain of unknown function (DUF5655)